MVSYIIRRLLFVIPTLLGIMTINFFIIQAAPGGPVEQLIAKIEGQQVSATARFSGGTSSELMDVKAKKDFSYRGAKGLDPELIARIEKMYGFDKPMHRRYLAMLANYACFDFGSSFYQDRSVISIILSKLPVSISLGVWSTLMIYLISIPLGIRKAVRHGSRFDVWSSTAVIIGNAVPVFLFAILLVVLFAGGSYFHWFPLRGLTSENWPQLSWPMKIVDYTWHLVLPVVSLCIGGFATLTMLTKNSFLEEIGKQYVVTARAKGISERKVLYGHVFRNAMLIVIAGFPSAFIGMFFAGSLLIEVIFSLDGLGLLGYTSTINRDYPVMFATLYIFTLAGLLLKIISDITYMLVDPRIDFESRM
jgi:microcin C transport system permease protein